MTDLPPAEPICGITEFTRKGWFHQCVLPMGHPRYTPWMKHRFEWMPGPNADPEGPGPEPGTPGPLPRREPGQELPKVPLNPNYGPVEPHPHPQPQLGPPEGHRPPNYRPTWTQMSNEAQERERRRREEEERARREREEREGPDAKILPLPVSHPVPGSRSSGFRWRRGLQEGAYTGPRGVDDSDDPTHDPDEVMRRRGKKPASTPTSPAPTTQGGTGMASVAEVKAGLAGADTMVTEAQGMLHDVQQKLDDAMAAYLATLQEASQETIEAIGSPVHGMKEHVADAVQAGQAAKEASQAYAARL